MYYPELQTVADTVAFHAARAARGGRDHLRRPHGQLPRAPRGEQPHGAGASRGGFRPWRARRLPRQGIGALLRHLLRLREERDGAGADQLAAHGRRGRPHPARLGHRDPVRGARARARPRSRRKKPCRGCAWWSISTARARSGAALPPGRQASRTPTSSRRPAATTRSCSFTPAEPPGCPRASCSRNAASSRSATASPSKVSTGSIGSLATSA